MNSKNYAVRCITNLHMGSGEANFNVVDNEVQRDPVTNAPAMFSSGVKGALRSHFDTVKPEAVKTLFGSSIDETRGGKGEGLTPGALKFLSGNLLLLPVRAAKGHAPYYMVTTQRLLQEWAYLYHTFTGKELVQGLEAAIAKLQQDKAYVNFHPVTIKLELREFAAGELGTIDKVIVAALGKVIEVAGQNLVILPEEQAQRAYQHLPVMARNQLDNGISKNLWYEEVVPHGAVFYFSVLDDGTQEGAQALQAFADGIEREPLVQCGGHATVGDGLTQLSAY